MFLGRCCWYGLSLHYCLFQSRLRSFSLALWAAWSAHQGRWESKDELPLFHLSCYSGCFSVCFGHTGRTGERGSKYREEAWSRDRERSSGGQTDSCSKPHLLPNTNRHPEHTSVGVQGSSWGIPGRAEEEGSGDQTLPSAPCWSWSVARGSPVHNQLRDQTYLSKGCARPNQGKPGEQRKPFKLTKCLGAIKTQHVNWH